MLPASDWRPHALDGALLWFHRKTGTNLRFDGPGTRHLRRRAPRLALFGITNACNLACGFCSRDLQARSDWTVDSAFDVLSGLARAGTLEVAFGGGEPLAFRGFDELVRRLATETKLAVHITTNGTLLSDERLARLTPYLGEVRVSLYDDNAWEETVQRLARSGQTFGVNILATPERLDALPAMLDTLAGLGCRDAAVLRYVGNDARLQLRAEDEARLTAVIAASPIRTRLSVCFGDALVEVPRLFGGDCGAGLDFVTLTSDRKLKACSFQGGGIPVASAEDVLASWAGRQEVLSAASPLKGCARAGIARGDRLPDGVRLWRGFSGNNSGDCVLVGRFETTQEATDFVEALLPGFARAQAYSAHWEALLTAEGIQIGEDASSPDSITAIGRTVLIHTGMTVGDDFAALRHLLWKRGGRVVHSVINGRDGHMLAVGFGAKAESSLERVEAALAVEELGTFVRQGPHLFGLVDFRETGVTINPLPTPRRVARLGDLAREHGAVLAAEMVKQLKEDDRFEQHLPFQPPSSSPERLWISFDKLESAERFARSLGGAFSVAGPDVLVEADHIGSRLGLIAQRHGGISKVLTSKRVTVLVTFGEADLEPAELASRLRPYLRPEDRVETSGSRRWSTLHVDTLEPLRVMPAVVERGKLLGMRTLVEVEAADPLMEALQRIRQELESELKRR
ncbi:radical SAM protein [Pyxidicoccus xibeiensis]|uniref:radical SAM protein n=1 Tax=Pyxidicoccus xibeiensis TaxID=2906759 RepID=UPI0020A7FD70|nr:radical SAM protein [Pyxidicoccus xibeiensis]MCP3143560.1 radical SAM protein [Pyxidicoccus xibeiensis]